MIKYNLICAQDHEFEGWFRDGATYDAQSAAGEIACPLCASAEVRKAPMAPSVVSSKRAAAIAAAEPPPPELSQLREALVTLRRHIESHATDVGDRFPDEVRKMHYGESEEKPIYGQASAEDQESLQEEGIDILPIPWVRMEN
jgi:hypothetical protein